MQQIKIFKNIESELPTMEAEMNEWLSENGAKVIQMSANIAPQSTSAANLGSNSFSSSDVMVVIVYET
jgi:hypothetical protein